MRGIARQGSWGIRTPAEHYLPAEIRAMEGAVGSERRKQKTSRIDSEVFGDSNSRRAHNLSRTIAYGWCPKRAVKDRNKKQGSSQLVVLGDSNPPGTYRVRSGRWSARKPPQRGDKNGKETKSEVLRESNPRRAHNLSRQRLYDTSDGSKAGRKIYGNRSRDLGGIEPPPAHNLSYDAMDGVRYTCRSYFTPFEPGYERYSASRASRVKVGIKKGFSRAEYRPWGNRTRAVHISSSSNLRKREWMVPGAPTDLITPRYTLHTGFANRKYGEPLRWGPRPRVEAIEGMDIRGRVLMCSAASEWNANTVLESCTGQRRHHWAALESLNQKPGEVIPAMRHARRTNSEYTIRHACYWAGKNSQIGWSCPNGDLFKDLIFLLSERRAPTQFTRVERGSTNLRAQAAQRLAQDGLKSTSPTSDYAPLLDRPWGDICVDEISIDVLKVSTALPELTTAKSSAWRDQVEEDEIHQDNPEHHRRREKVRLLQKDL
ncbi:hypothetical protein DFH09DRAFT_1091599 [Mycena vulgaris]|nr:hypothetical protein DFH09DRAFT_1091599 [Mycena vulgaris]